jgi:CDP-diacylglycerol---serine O-phosphatidyltransferase
VLSSVAGWLLLRFFDLANAVSLVALLAAAACSWFSISRLPAYGVVALIVSGLADLLDGQVARLLPRTDEQRRFGQSLDSLVDACSFGFAPATLLYAIGLDHPLDLVLLGFFLSCTVWRLAYFDTTGLETSGSSHYFTGLPTTYVALVMPLVFLTVLAGPFWLHGSLRVATVLLALAMISPFRFRKPGLVVYGFLLLLAMAVASLLLWQAPQIHQRLRV